MWGWNLKNAVARNRQRLPLWQSALEQCEVSGVESSGLRQVQLTGRSGPIEVRIADAPGKGSGIVVALAGPEGLSVLQLRRRSFRLPVREIEVGDEGFDETFVIEGEIRPVCALLDVWLRRELVQTNAACVSLEIRDGELRVEIPEEDLGSLLPRLLGIGRKLAEPLDAERRIARNARRDPKPGVRLRNLLLLAREQPGAPDTLEALRAACLDASARIRLRAAIELGEEGYETLLQIAESTVDDDLRIQAISHLGPHLPFESVRGILARSLHKDRIQIARACLERLGQIGAPAVDLLAQVLAEQRPELGIAAAQALGATGEAAAEAPLLQALQSEDALLCIAAAAALGQTGSAASVQPLREAAELRWRDRAFRQAAHQSIAGIQSRLTGASPGQLSLAATEAGQLSLATDPAGQLALSPDEPEADSKETVCRG